MSGKQLEKKLSLSVLPWKNTKIALEKLQNLLRCNKCQQLPSSPQYMGRCDHFFCQTCINDIKESWCPICKIPSTPCERKPDIIVGGLVSSVSEMFTLINGGEVKQTKGLEAPESSMTLDNISNNISMQTTTRKTGVLRSSTGPGNQPSIKTETSIPTYNNNNISKANGRPSRLPKKVSPEDKETNMTKSKSENLLMKDNEKKENALFTKTLSVVLKSVINTPPPAKYAKLHEHNLALTGITPTTPAVNKRNVKGETPLHIACIKKDIQTIKKLLEDGANPNTKDNAGWTPLHEACSHGFEEVATLLLEHGALVDVPGSNNMTPLHDAVITETIPVISLLRKWGASESSRDIWGRTPRSLASHTKSAELIISALETRKDAFLIPKSSFGPLLSKFVLLDSGLSAEQKKKFETVAKLLKAKLVKDFSTEVTHIIVNCDGSKVCQRTVKYMMGVVSGKWILSHKWLDACLSISGPANPLEFEVEGPRSNPCCLAPSKGRSNAFKMLPGLFSGCHIYFHGSFGGDLPSKKELESLVKAGDCVPLCREPNPEAIGENEQTVPFHTSWDGPLSKCSHYIIFAEGIHEPQIQYDMAHIKSLPISWLYQCIDEWCLSSLQK